MKKFVNFFIFVFLLTQVIPNFTLGASDSGTGGGGSLFSEYVPVIDEKAVRTLVRIADVLDSLVVLNSEEFQKLNLQIAKLLDNQYKDAAANAINDALKDMGFRDFVGESIGLLNAHRITDLSQISDEIEDAKKAGAYNGLINFVDFIRRDRNFLYPEEKADLIQTIRNRGFSDLDLEQIALKMITDIPSPSPASYQASNYQPTLSLIAPFNLGRLLAQFSGNGGGLSSELPSVAIRPVFEETQINILSSYTQSSLISEVLNNISFQKDERVLQIGGFKPLYQTCSKWITTDSDIVCANKITVIGVEHLSSILTNNSNFSQSFSTPNTYQEIFSLSSLAARTLINREEMASGVNLSNIDTVINRRCLSYLQRPDAVSTKAIISYLDCLKSFNGEFRSLIEAERTKLISLIDLINRTFGDFNQVLVEVRNLQGQVGNCTELSRRLSKYEGFLEGRLNFYSSVRTEAESKLADISRIEQQINENEVAINNLIYQLRRSGFEILSVLTRFLQWYYSENPDFFQITDLQKSLIPQFLAYTTSTITEEMIDDFLNQLNAIYDQQKQLLESIARLSEELSQSKFSRLMVISDRYKAREILENTYAYRDILDRVSRGEIYFPCVSGNTGLSLQKKPEVIIVKSDQNIKKSPLSFLTNIFRSYSIEINFKK